MMEAVSVTEELEAHPLINNMKEREKNNFKIPRLLNFGENIKYRLWCSFFTNQFSVLSW